MCYKVRQEDNLSRSSVNGRFPNWAAWLTGERSLRAVSSSGMKRTAAAGCWATEREPGWVRCEVIHIMSRLMSVSRSERGPQPRPPINPHSSRLLSLPQAAELQWAGPFHCGDSPHSPQSCLDPQPGHTCTGVQLCHRSLPLTLAGPHLRAPCVHARPAVVSRRSWLPGQSSATDRELPL